jgi:hypothetical protein
VHHQVGVDCDSLVCHVEKQGGVLAVLQGSELAQLRDDAGGNGW